MPEKKVWDGRTPDELWDARMALDLERRCLAKLLGIDENTLWRRETGVTTRIAWDTMWAWNSKLLEFEKRARKRNG